MARYPRRGDADRFRRIDVTGLTAMRCTTERKLGGCESKLIGNAVLHHRQSLERLDRGTRVYHEIGVAAVRAQLTRCIANRN